MLSRVGAGSQAARPSIVSHPRWRRARSQTRPGSDPRESWLRTRAAPISARRSLMITHRRGSKGKPDGVAVYRAVARNYRIGSGSKPALAPKAPIDHAARPNGSRHLPAKLAFQGRCPRDEIEPEPVVTHGKAARCQADALTVDTRDAFDLCERMIGQTGLCRDLCAGGIEL